jgi:hypothetical protein
VLTIATYGVSPIKNAFKSKPAPARPGSDDALEKPTPLTDNGPDLLGPAGGFAGASFLFIAFAYAAWCATGVICGQGCERAVAAVTGKP